MPFTLCCCMPLVLHTLPTCILELRVQRGETAYDTAEPRGMAVGLSPSLCSH